MSEEQVVDAEVVEGQELAEDVPPVQVDSLREAIHELRRPFTPEAVKFKIQTNPKSDQGKAMVVTFIDARLVSERLNAVCPHLWSTEFEEVAGGMLCKLTIDGRTRADAGHAENTGTDIGLKSLYSDAFKRAAVHFGVGASLYTLPRVYVPASRLKKVERQDGKTLWFLPAETERSLRGGYATWLDQQGRRLFGEALDHGDQDGAQGDTEADGDTGKGVEDDSDGSDGAGRSSNGRSGSDIPSEKQLTLIDRRARDLGADDETALMLVAYAEKNLTGGREGSASKVIDRLLVKNSVATQQTLVEFVAAAAKWNATLADAPADTAGL